LRFLSALHSTATDIAGYVTNLSFVSSLLPPPRLCAFHTERMSSAIQLHIAHNTLDTPLATEVKEAHHAIQVCHPRFISPTQADLQQARTFREGSREYTTLPAVATTTKKASFVTSNA
jgi:hypothetical protein